MSDLILTKGFIDAISKTMGKKQVAQFVKIKNAINDKTTKIDDGTEDNVVSIDENGNIQDSLKSLPTGTIVGTTDTQTLTNKTLTLAGASDVLGSTAIADNSTSKLDPDALTSTDVVAADADATYGAAERDLINEIKADYNLLRADVDALRTSIIGVIDYCDSLKGTMNTLLAELRKTGGCGVLQ